MVIRVTVYKKSMFSGHVSIHNSLCVLPAFHIIIHLHFHPWFPSQTFQEQQCFKRVRRNTSRNQKKKHAGARSLHLQGDFTSPAIRETHLHGQIKGVLVWRLGHRLGCLGVRGGRRGRYRGVGAALPETRWGVSHQSL